MHIMDYAGVQAIDFSTICPKVDSSKPHMFERVLSASPEQGGGAAVSAFIWGRGVPADSTTHGRRIGSLLDLAHAL